MSDWKEGPLSQKQLGDEYVAAFSRLSSVLFAEDPAGVNYDDNTDEYDPEALMIVVRLHYCSGPKDVVRVIKEVVSAQWDGPPRPFFRYGKLARRIWDEVVPLLPRKQSQAPQ